MKRIEFTSISTIAGHHSRLRACKPLTAVAATILAFAGWTATARATLIDVPNGSFELPATTFVNTNIDSWQKPAQPFWFDPAAFGGIQWNQLTGVFANPPPSNTTHIDNVDGSQAAFLFGVPEVALFQDLMTPGGTFELGKSYELTVGLIGGLGGMPLGSSFELSLYYRDGANNMVTVASALVANSPVNFPSTTHLVDFTVALPAVQAGDAWLGKNIGIKLASGADFSNIGGYWDVDNVRLTSASVPDSPLPAGLFALGLGGLLLVHHQLLRRRLA